MSGNDFRKSLVLSRWRKVKSDRDVAASVPDMRSSDRESPVTDCWTPGRWHQQTTGATRA